MHFSIQNAQGGTITLAKTSVNTHGSDTKTPKPRDACNKLAQVRREALLYLNPQRTFLSH